MSDAPDFEEGEVGDVSDLEECSLGGSRPATPLEPQSDTRHKLSRGVSSHRRDSHSDNWPDDDYGDRMGHRTSSRSNRSPEIPSLLHLLSDDESNSRRKVRHGSQCNRIKHQPPGQKKRKKRRDWAPGSSRHSAVKHERSRCRFYLEGRCNKVSHVSDMLTSFKGL